MNTRQKNAVGLCGLLALAFIGWYVWADVREVVRADYVRARVKEIALCVEWFEVDHGRYPLSLEELLTDEEPDRKKSAASLLQSKMMSDYEYRILPGGFSIGVSRRNKWHQKVRVEMEFIERSDKAEERTHSAGKSLSQ